MEIIDAMDGAGVARALNAQVPWYGEDNRYHHESAARFPGPFALLGVIDPASAGAPERLERMAREEGAGGFRIHFNEPGRRDQVLEPPPYGSVREFFALGALGNVDIKVSLLCDHSRQVERRTLDLVRADWNWLSKRDREWILGRSAAALWKFPAGPGR